jgi:nitrogen-specific signal transduction histidine kinase
LNELKKISEQLKMQSGTGQQRHSKRWISGYGYPWIENTITAIRAASEILLTMMTTFRGVEKAVLQNIISESDRLNRLIDKIWI